MSSALSALSWSSAVLAIVPLAILLMGSLRSGAAIQIAAHALLLVVGAAIVLALQPDDAEHPPGR